MLKERLLPAFDGIEEEASAKSDEAWAVYRSMPYDEDGPMIDEPHVAEFAQGVGLEHYLACQIDLRRCLTACD